MLQKKNNCVQILFFPAGWYFKHDNIKIIYHPHDPSMLGKGSRVNYCNDYVQIRQNKVSYNKNNPLGFLCRVTRSQKHRRQVLKILLYFYRGTFTPESQT